VNGQSPGTELQGNASILKTTGGELETGVEAGTIQPAEFGDAPFAGAGRLDPTQGLGPSAAVVCQKEDIPPPKGHNCADNVDDKKASHGRLRLPL